MASPGRLTPSKPSPDGTDNLSTMPDIVMYIILSYLPDTSVDLLSQTSKTMERTQVLGEKYYWATKLAKFLGLESIPPEALIDVDAKKAYKESCSCGNIVTHAKRGHSDAVAVLLNLDLCTPQEAQSGLSTAINHEIESVISVYIEKNRVGTPVKWAQLFNEACSKGMTTIIRMLLEGDKITTHSRGQGLLLALETRDQERAERVVKLFLHDTLTPISHFNMALTKAARNGNPGAVEQLLKKHGINPRHNNSEALREAVAYSEYVIVKLLLEDGRADPHANNNEAYIIASRLKQGAKVADLLRDYQVPRHGQVPDSTRVLSRS